MKSLSRSIWRISTVAAMGIHTLSAELEVVATSPAEFKILSATDSSPSLQQVLDTVNPWGVACDPDTELIYFSDPTAGLIGSIDPTAMSVTVTPLISRPASVFHGIELDAINQRLFFLDSSDDSVNVINLDGTDEAQVLSDTGINRPNDIAYDPDRDWIFFTDSGTDMVGIIKDGGQSGTFQSILKSETTGAWGIVIDPATGDAIFSSHDNGTVHRLNPDTEAVTLIESGLDGPRGLHIDRHGRLFCLESGQNRIRQIALPGSPLTSQDFTTASNGRDFLLFHTGDKDNDLLLDEWEYRHAMSLSELSTNSDPEGDGRSAFFEMLFNGSPQSGADPDPIQSLTRSPAGGLTAVIHGPSSGYDFNPEISSNLNSWQPFSESLAESAHADTLYSTWTLTIPDLSALGLDPNQVFIRYDGLVTPPAVTLPP